MSYATQAWRERYASYAFARFPLLFHSSPPTSDGGGENKWAPLRRRDAHTVRERSRN